MEDLNLSSSEGTESSSGSAAQETSSTSSSSGGSTSTKESPSSVDWEGILGQASSAPPEVLQKLLEAHPELAKTATRNVRKAEVQKLAEAQAEQFYSTRSAQTLSELETLRRQNNELLARNREAVLSTLSDSEQEAYKLREANQTQASELNYYKTVFAQREEQGAKDQIIQVAREDWGFDDDDVKKLEGADSVDKFVNTALKLSGEKRKRMADETKTLSEKLDALSRVVNGTSVHAATAHASSGGDSSYTDTEQGYLDGTVPLSRYLEARKKAGIGA